MTLGVWLPLAKARLSAAGIEAASLESHLLAAHIFRMDRAWVIAHPEVELNELAAEALLQRREAREPLAYILGWREFYGRRFSVSQAVLIPRQETEVLVEVMLDLSAVGPVLDLCTGSGCIGITVKLERPSLDVYVSDVSPGALEVAEHNAEALHSDVHLILSDGFDSLPPVQFEVIGSNPPYISTGESLMPEVSGFEPETALFSGPTGLEFYERIALQAPRHLKPNGFVAAEVGHTQSEAVAEIFSIKGWQVTEVVRDLSGIERVVVAKREWN